MPGPAAADDSGDQVERLLEDLLDAPDAQHEVGLARLCAAHPELAAALRARFESYRVLSSASFGEGVGAGRFGDYELVRPLGRGGMGVVWFARQQRGPLQREVALKLIHHAALHSTAARMRFRREASAAMRLDHPGICSVYDVGEVEGTPFMALRLVPGRTLAEHIDEARKQGVPLTLRIAAANGTAVATSTGGRHRIDAILSFVEHAARAVHAAHEAGLVHRDIKPGNLMVTPGGEPVLLDFGLARDVAEIDGLTVTGQRLGTPLYMAPEQFVPAGRTIGRTTDVYGLGAVLYECFALRPPFMGQTEEELLLRVLHEPPPRVRRIDSSLPAQLDLVIETALRKDPERRYPTALALAEDLCRLREQQPITARRTGTVLRMRLWAQRNPVIAIVLVLLAVALGVTLWQTTEAQAARRSSERSFQRAQGAIAQMVEVARDQLRDAPGFANERRQMLTRALAFYEELLTEPASDAGTRQAWALARAEAGKLRKEFDDLEGAHADLQAALRELEPGIEAGSRDPTLSYGVAQALRSLAGVEFERGNLAMARSLSDRTVVAFERLMALPGSSAAHWLSFCELTVFRATVAFHEERWDHLETLVADVLAQIANHTQGQALTPKYTLRAQAYVRRGAAHCRKQRREEGLAALDLAVRDYRAALAAAPRSRALRAKVAEVLQQHSDLALSLGHGDAAFGSAREALVRYEDLGRDFPEVGAYSAGADRARASVAGMESGASAQSDTGSPASAAATAATASPKAARDRLKAVLEKADLARREGDHAAAHRCWTEAVELFDPAQARAWSDVERALVIINRLLPLSQDLEPLLLRATGWSSGFQRLGAMPEGVAVAFGELWLLRSMRSLEREDWGDAESAAAAAAPLVAPRRRLEAWLLHAEAVTMADPARGLILAEALATTVPPEAELAAWLVAGSRRIVGLARRAQGNTEAAAAAWQEARQRLGAASEALRAEPAIRCELALVAADLATLSAEAKRGGEAAEFAREAWLALLAVSSEGVKGPAQRHATRARARLRDLPDAALGPDAAEMREFLRR